MSLFASPFFPSPRHGAWPILCATLVAWTAASAARGQPAAEAPIAATPSWYRGGTIRTVAGYADNVQWSAIESRGRGFAQGEIEAYAIHPRRERWELRTVVSGEVRRYADPLPESAGEQRWIGRGEVAFTPREALRLSLVGQGFYQDQVYDLSAEAGRRFVAQMRVGGWMATLQPRIAVRGWEIEPSVQTRETDYFDFAEDFSEVRSGLRVRWKGRGNFQAGAAVHEHRRDYEERVNYNAGGRALPGTRLRFEQIAAEARVGWAWDGKETHWAISPVVMHTTNRDGAAGFFDYDLARVRCDFALETARWRVDADVSAGRYDYRVQKVGMGISPPARLREDYGVNVAVERRLSAKWTALARASWERSRSNEINASYRVASVAAGLAWAY